MASARAVRSDSPVQFCTLAMKGTDRRVVTLREVLFGAGSPDSTLSSSWLQRLAAMSIFPEIQDFRSVCVRRRRLGSEHGAEVRVVKCYGWEVGICSRSGAAPLCFRAA